MDEVTEDFENSDLENLVIKDKAYKRKQLIKILIIILIIIIILLIIAIVVYFILKNKKKPMVKLFVFTKLYIIMKI